MRVAATADLHYQASSGGLVQELFSGVKQQADVLVIAGDLTHTGHLLEAELLARDLQALGMPVIAVLGNHDHAGDQQEAITALLKGCGVTMLDGTVCEMDGVSFVGTKGFIGGFGDELVRPFGEQMLRTFVGAGVEEAQRLGAVLQGVRTVRKMVVLHYAPIRATLLGEPPEIHAFLGNSHLAAAVDACGADLIVHGHAHFGLPKGRTPHGIPVYNVCRFVQGYLLRRPYKIVSL